MHGSEVIVFGTDANDFLDHLDGVRIFGVKTCDVSIGIACLNHHHTEIVALEHLVVGLLEGVAVALALVGENHGIALTTLLLGGMAQVDNLDTVDVEVEFLCQFGDNLIVAQEDGLADAFGLGLNSGLEHGGVNSLGKDDALWVGCCCSIELLRELRLLSQQYAERILILVPVLNLLASHTAVDGSLSHGGAHLGDETWVNRFRNEVLATEAQVVHLIYIVHHIGHGLLGQIGNGVDGSQLHLLVDGCGVDVERTAEDVGESDDVVNLVGIVSTTG